MDSEGAMSEPAPSKARLTLAAGWSPDHPTRRGFMRMLDASAVKVTFDHIVDRATKSKSAAGSLGPYKETQVVDKYTAKVVFSTPNAAFQNEMTGFSIISPAALQKFGADFDHNPVGTGP